jgi:Uncharacterized protein conserved in bacteria (DUF2171)
VSGDDPVAWYLIEPGWEVLDAGGDVVGLVEEVEGDANADIFSGLAISTGLFSGPRFVPAEQVGLLTEGHVHLSLTSDQVKDLPDTTRPAGT